ncbi:MAG: T9SS type A sorting domain-containing protein [Bacteroidales bacterium]|nr:T9SS type A sorting domain-containing protein [Bacteroidales bacterium]
MKRTFTLLAACVFVMSAFAQSTVDVVTGAGYANEAYYSFTGGTVSTSDRTAWDLSFPTNRYGINILANSGAMVELYTYTGGDISAWETLDTTGMTWTPLYNSIASWDEGAFMQNQVEGDDFDYGWGRYSMANHHIVGDSLYVILTASGSYKKLWIVDKDPNSGANTWIFKFANLDGTDEHTDTLEADPYMDKNHISYSLESKQVVENESTSADWDLVFTKYYDYTIPYYVTGVLANSARVSLQEVSGVAQADYETFSESDFKDTISVIGSDWKTFDMGSMAYVLDDDRVFFAKVMNAEGTDSTYWKMYFTAFTGSSEGKYTFEQKLLDAPTSTGATLEISMLELYPNPASDHITIVLDARGDVRVRMYNTAGQMVHQQAITAGGFDQHALSIGHLQTGMYTIIVEAENYVSHNKFLKQ